MSVDTTFKEEMDFILNYIANKVDVLFSKGVVLP